MALTAIEVIGHPWLLLPDHQIALEERLKDGIIVVGMPRSGTSAVAAVLDRLGVFMGWRRTGADKFNPRGYYEDRDWLELHDLTISKRVELEMFKVVSAFYVKKRRLLGHRWGFKDPRAMLFLPHYQQLMPDAKFIVTARDGTDIHASLGRVFEGTDPQDVTTYYNAFAGAMVKHCQGLYCLTVHFAGMQEDPAGLVEAIINFCELEVTEERRAAAIQVISGDPYADLSGKPPDTED